VERSKTFRAQLPAGYDPKSPPLLRPGLDTTAVAEAVAAARIASRN
jgi:hypothetical protein